MSTNTSDSHDEDISQRSSGSSSSTDTTLDAVLEDDDIHKHFEIVKSIGEGAFGSVFEIKSRTDKKNYALKVVPSSPERMMKDEKRIVREVEVLSQLQHANIVRYHTSWYFKTKAKEFRESTIFQCLCIQMEYCDQTLQDFIQNMNEYDTNNREVERRRISAEIVDGIKYIHDENIMHRDLKPTNIFLSKYGTVKIGDFGIARNETNNDKIEIVSDEDENLTSYIGTKLYCAPEVLNHDEKYDKRIDLYSLGLIIFEMWTTFETKMEKCKIFERIKSPTISVPDSLQQTIVKDIVIGLLQHEPDKRMGLDKVVDKMLLFDKEEIFTDNAPIQQIQNRPASELKRSVGRIVCMHSKDKYVVKGSCFRLGSGPYLVTPYSVVKRKMSAKRWFVFFERSKKSKKTILKEKNPIWRNRDLDIAILEFEISDISYEPEILNLQNQDITQKKCVLKHINNEMIEIDDWPKELEGPTSEMLINFESSASGKGEPVISVSEQNDISVFGIIIGPIYKNGVKEEGKTIIRNLESIYESVNPVLPAEIRKALFSNTSYYQCHERFMRKLEKYINRESPDDNCVPLSWTSIPH